MMTSDSVFEAGRADDLLRRLAAPTRLLFLPLLVGISGTAFAGGANELTSDLLAAGAAFKDAWTLDDVEAL